MKIKQYILLILSFLIVANNYAQKAKPKKYPTYDDRHIHFGMSFGLNYMDFSFRRIPFDPNKAIYALPELNNISPGFQINAVTDFRLGEYFRFRMLPGCSFGDRTINYWQSVGNKETKVDSIKIESSFAEMPILFKYKAKRINNYSPYIIAGVNPRWDFEARKKHDNGSKQYVLLNHFDLYYEMGIGLDFYNQFFKFATELKLSLGMLDIVNHTPSPVAANYTNAIDQLHSKMVMLTFYFE